jgi:hypothetical protein
MPDLQAVVKVEERIMLWTDREEDFDLIEPTGMDGRMHLNGIGIPLDETAHRLLTAVRRSVVGNPEHPPRGKALAS